MFLSQPRDFPVVAVEEGPDRGLSHPTFVPPLIQVPEACRFSLSELRASLAIRTNSVRRSFSVAQSRNSLTFLGWDNVGGGTIGVPAFLVVVDSITGGWDETELLYKG